MQTIVSRLNQSVSIKVFGIGFLILVLLIPLGMIRGTINDRDQVHQDARLDIQRTWGQSQTIAGPVLVLPYDAVHVNQSGERFVNLLSSVPRHIQGSRVFGRHSAERQLRSDRCE